MSFCFRLLVRVRARARKKKPEKKKNESKKKSLPSILTGQPRYVQHLVHLARVRNVRVALPLDLLGVLLRRATDLVNENRHVARLLVVVGPERLEVLEGPRGRVRHCDAELGGAVVNRVDVHPHDVPLERVGVGELERSERERERKEMSESERGRK